MDHFQRIYTGRAGDYHRMIAAEDVDGHLLAALREAAPLRGRRVLDLGTGTGRLPLLLAGEAGLMVGLDVHRAMLQENAEQRRLAGGTWPLVQADMRALPFPAGAADVVMAGWAIGHLRGWHPDNWQVQIGQVLREMERVAAAGGHLIILETLTTGGHEPRPPTPELAEYYAWLEGEWGYARRAISTDYAFADAGQAAARTEFFFGPELAEAIRRNDWARLPEWTGIWSKRAGRGDACVAPTQRGEG